MSKMPKIMAFCPFKWKAVDYFIKYIQIKQLNPLHLQISVYPALYLKPYNVFQSLPASIRRQSMTIYFLALNENSDMLQNCIFIELSKQNRKKIT